MAKINTNGNAYTILYATGIVVIVAFLLAFVYTALKPTQDANVAIDKKQQILAALNIRNVEKADVQAKFAEVILQDMVYEANSTKVIDEGKSATKDEGGFKVEAKELKAKRPFYVAQIGGKTCYVIPVSGAGLWGGIAGFIALEEDCETIRGTYFSHESETAGLGARITEEEFQTSFATKKLHAAGNDQEVVFSVVKKGSNAEKKLDPSNYVNGITGATLTSNGVDAMVREGLQAYQDILDMYKNK